MSLMWSAKYCFQAIANHQVISHIYHAKQVVPFTAMKKMKMPYYKNAYPLKYYEV